MATPRPTRQSVQPQTESERRALFTVQMLVALTVVGIAAWVTLNEAQEGVILASYGLVAMVLPTIFGAAGRR
jgi:hypothetical protein